MCAGVRRIDEMHGSVIKEGGLGILNRESLTNRLE